MAAVASTETVKIKVNEVEIEVPKGEIICESVKRLGLEIPIFCYHARMKPVGMCRMCLVEVGYTGPVCIEVEDDTFGKTLDGRKAAVKVAGNVLRPYFD